VDYRWLYSLQNSKDCWLPEAMRSFQAIVPQWASRIVPTILAYVGGKQLNS